MRRQFILLGLFGLLTGSLAFLIRKPETEAEAVKALYLRQGAVFLQSITAFQQTLRGNDEKNMQQQFRSMRAAYKEIETLVEYYFSFFATRLNGPPIPFFEEEEPDRGQQEPAGMQLIETYLFPHVKRSGHNALMKATDELLQDTHTMLETMESNAFNDELIFDAVTEELFRITALGMSGFDSQLAGNGLQENKAAITGLEMILLLYKDQLNATKPARAPALLSLLKNARHYLDAQHSFTLFDRMQFITRYLDPVAAEIGAFKTTKGFTGNPSPMFYSTVRKNNSLFAPEIFDVGKYLDDNSTSPEKIRLGKMLFFEKQLSKDNSRSCATCHDPARAFTDGLPTSVAIDGHTALPRNAPTLLNSALQRNLFLDNRSFSLEDQVMAVLNNAREMHGSATLAAEKILGQERYRALYASAYPGASKEAAARNICNAIACYERTLIALNAKFDRHMRGEYNLSRDEINGFNLFMGKARCGTCHFLPLFSGAKPPRYYYNETEVIGVPDKDVRAQAKLDEDEGRFLVTALPIHKFSFKTPTLRNIDRTAPYMHNGAFKTLEAVIEFYNNGGGSGLGIAPSDQTLPPEKLQLTASEKKQLVAFLKTLTDTTVNFR